MGEGVERGFCERQWRRRGACKKPAARNDPVAKLFAAEDRASECPECLAECNGAYDAFVANGEMISRAASVFAEHARAMRVVQQQHSIGWQSANQVGHWRDTAILREHAVREQRDAREFAAAGDSLRGVNRIAMLVFDDRAIKELCRVLQTAVRALIDHDV